LLGHLGTPGIPAFPKAWRGVDFEPWNLLRYLGKQAADRFHPGDILVLELHSHWQLTFPFDLHQVH
jgi:hypothetical protein